MTCSHFAVGTLLLAELAIERVGRCRPVSRLGGVAVVEGRAFDDEARNFRAWDHRAAGDFDGLQLFRFDEAPARRGADAELCAARLKAIRCAQLREDLRIGVHLRRFLLWQRSSQSASLSFPATPINSHESANVEMCKSAD